MNQLPSFLCIGTQKAGTSWLYEQLRQHPAVWMPPIKELHYFDHLYCKSNRSWSKWHIRQGVGRALKQHIENNEAVDFVYIRYLSNIVTEPMFSEVWYEQLYQRPAAKGKTLGDITPEYCAIGDEGIDYVKRFLGNVKIVWLIRDPVERAMSQLRMNAERRGLSADTPVQEWMEMAESEEVFSRGDYLDYIPRWQRGFGENSILFIPFKQIAAQPKKVLRTVEAFIGVNAWDGYPAPGKKIHATQPFALPEQVVSYLDERFQRQYHFLNDYFDADFVNGI